jgi:hypothetical protein
MRAWLLTIGAACPATCYGGTCDYWDGGYWGTCAKLTTFYGCDCSGCECDGCPQGSCDDLPFDPSRCPGSGNAQCEAQYNTAECAWDGGDCCEDTCIGVLCGSRGFDCKTANVQEVQEEAVASVAVEKIAEDQAIEKHLESPRTEVQDTHQAGGLLAGAGAGAVAVAVLIGLAGLRVWRNRQATGAVVRVPKHADMETGASKEKLASDALETASTATPDTLGANDDLEAVSLDQSLDTVEAQTLVQQSIGEPTYG